VGEFGADNFPQALISNGLQIICKVFGKIYTPGEYRGGGGTHFSVVNYPSEQRPLASDPGSDLELDAFLSLVHGMIVRQ
jgi:hypothetical protein